MPAFSINSTKGAELPSIMGISGPVTSIKQLSIPNPTNAANTCSTVLIFAPLDSRVVPRLVSVTRSQSALITGCSGKSVLLNCNPNPGLAGCRVRSAKMPVCSPVPEMVTGLPMVCCLSGLKGVAMSGFWCRKDNKCGRDRKLGY